MGQDISAHSKIGLLKDVGVKQTHKKLYICPGNSDGMTPKNPYF